MFANTYQNGYFTEVWDSRVNPQKNPLYKQLFKKIPSSMKNFYDKQVKSFIYELEGNERLSFPFDDRQQELSLHQRYLVLQIFIPLGSNWSIQLGINDISNSKKRINITTTSGKQELKYFSFRYPLQNGAIQKGVWMFLAIDVYSFCNAFKNTVFRSLDTIVVCSFCKIRRIFTMKEWTEFQIPKQYWLAANIPQIMQLIQFKETKQILQSNNMISSTVQYSKMTQSKMLQNQPSVLRNSQKSSPLQQKSNTKGVIKLPGVNNNNNRVKQLTPLKSSKLSEKIQLGKSELVKQFGILGKSNRSLTKADIIIQKSKIRLNSLQQKQEQILNRLKSQDNRFSQKLPIKQFNKLKNENLFKSDLFKSHLSQSGDSKISRLNNSPKIYKVKKSFEQDNIFKQQQYSSSYSRQTQKDSAQTIRNPKKVLNKDNNNMNNSGIEVSSILNIELNKIMAEQQQSVNMSKKSLINNIRQSKISVNIKQSKISVNNKQRQQIIQQDVWTQQDQRQQQQIIKSQTPIQQIIQSQQHNISLLNNNNKISKINGNQQKINHPIKINPINISSNNIQPVDNNICQTIITRKNNRQYITKVSLNNLNNNNQLQLIYDQMIGCYYHPQTNTYYQIKM